MKPALGWLKLQESALRESERRFKRHALLLILAGAILIVLSHLAIWSMLGTAHRNSGRPYADGHSGGARTMQEGSSSVHSTGSAP